MSPLKISLLVGGAVFEFAGIIVLAFPDVLPYGVRFSQWLRKHARCLLDQIRRVLRRRRRGMVIEIGTASEVDVAGSVSMIKSASGAPATLEEKVAFLLRRDQEAQRDVTHSGGGSMTLRQNRQSGLSSRDRRSRRFSHRN